MPADTRYMSIDFSTWRYVLAREHVQIDTDLRLFYLFSLFYISYIAFVSLNLGNALHKSLRKSKRILDYYLIICCTIISRARTGLQNENKIILENNFLGCYLGKWQIFMRISWLKSKTILNKRKIANRFTTVPRKYSKWSNIRKLLWSLRNKSYDLIPLHCCSATVFVTILTRRWSQNNIMW